MNDMKIYLFLIAAYFIFSKPCFTQTKHDSTKIQDSIHIVEGTIQLVPDSIHIIDKSEVIKIAMNYRFENSTEGWRVSLFYCNGDVSEYVWTVENTLSVSGNVTRGKVMRIFARTGKIEGVYNWIRTSD